MDKFVNKKSKIQLPNIKFIVKRDNFNKKKLLKYNESQFDNSINKILASNENKKRNNIFLHYENIKTQSHAQYNPYNTNTEFFKMKLKNKSKIFSYNIKGLQQKNGSLKYIYKSPESNDDLRRYTNNSSSFRIFNGQDNPYQSYTIKKLKKIEKPILLQSPKNIESMSSTRFLSNNSKFYSNNSYKNYFNNNFENRKENSKVFIKIPPIDLSELIEKSNDNDLELRDKVDIKILENEKLREKIRISLLLDINHDKKYNKLYSDFLKPINHYIDFYQDIYIIPHIKNNFAFSKPVKDLEVLSHKLCDKNLFHKQIVLTMNRVSIIREQLIKQKKIDYQKMIEEEQDMMFGLKHNNIEEEKVDQYEKKYEKYELQDSFEKSTNHQIISFADKKMRECIFTKNFYKNK